MDRNLQWLTVGVAVRMLGNALYNPFLALFLQSTLHLSYIDIGLIVVAVGLVQLPFNFLGGLFTDRLGRRRLILAGLAGEAGATALLGYAFLLPSLPLAIGAALIGGTIATVAGPAFSAYVADFAEGSQRTLGFTWLRIGFNAGYSAGVTLGGLLVTDLGFGRSVGVAALIIAGATALLFVYLGPSPFDRRLAEGARAVAATPGPAVQGPSLLDSLRIIGRDRRALEVLLAILFAGIVVGQWAITFPLFVHNVLAVPYSLLGIGLALNGLIVVFGQRSTTQSVLGWRHTSIAILGTVLYVVAFLGLGLSGLFLLVPTIVFFAAVFVLTVGENLITIPQSTLPSNLAPPTEIGSYNGAFAMVGGAGFLASVLLGTSVLSAGWNPLLTWVVLVVPAIPAVWLFHDAGRRIPEAANRA